jgi:NADH:ubiquinone oxidoreductase subunit F (NADH-binding)
VTVVVDAERVGTRLRLLSAWDATHRCDLAGHLSHYGPLPELRGDLVESFVRSVAGAGLSGRGGAGFPTAVKLRARRDAVGRDRWVAGHRAGAGRATRRPGAPRGVVVVNAMEGEPASSKDEVLLCCAPHLVLDGAEVAAAVVGARGVVVCVPEGRDAAAASVTRAIGERGRAARVPADVARPPGRFVAGEESSLVGWLSGRPGVPSFRLDKGVPLLLEAEPVVVHNAETVAHMALIARDPGLADPTALVTISGAVARPGVYEVELGSPLRDVLSPASPRDAAAVLVGGYGGAWVAASAFDTPYSSEGLGRVGAAPGAGVLVVLPLGACGISETARIAAYMAGESAGQCGPCVFGLAAIADDLCALATGVADADVLERLGRRTAAVTGRGACRHPDGVARMVQSALGVFSADALAHADGRPCGMPCTAPLAHRGAGR